jgi:putative aminopeptidase FrvX
VTVEIVTDRMLDFLVGLLNTPSPTGDTGQAVEYVVQAFAELPLELRTTPKGVLVGTWPGERSDMPRAVTAHIGTLGAMVKHIKDNGRLRLTQVGSWVWASVEGEGVTIFASNDQQYRGAILPTAASAHAYDERKLVARRTEATIEVRVDARTSSAAETRALGIQVGDYVAIDPRVEVGHTGFIRARHLDDKAGVAAIYGGLQAIARAGLKPKQRTTVHISIFEEAGHGGASGLPEDLVELLAVDMAVVAPEQQSDEFSVGICAKDAKALPPGAASPAGKAGPTGRHMLSHRSLPALWLRRPDLLAGGR